MLDWLPSERTWIEQLTERTLAGEVLLVRSIPRWGLTSVCSSIVGVLGASAVMVNGRRITEQNQETERERIDAEVAAAIRTAGYAQLIFDDYGRSIRRSQGGALHSMLYRLLIDSEAARDTGALLVARSGDMLDFNFAGSPLISRAQMLVLPELAEEDATALGTNLAALKKATGESTWLARRFMNVSTRQGQVSAVEHLNSDRRRIIQALPPSAIEALVGARTAAEIDPVSCEALRCLGSINESGEFELSTLVSESALPEEVRILNPGWPAAFPDSVQRFADHLAAVDNAIWVDRYLFREPTRARTFLQALRKLTSARLRLLVSDDRDRAGFANEIVSAIAGLDNVSVRFMHRHDRKLLHDRHLVFPALGSGFVLPTAGVILGADAPGSAVSVRMPALSINFADHWNRATPP